MKREFPITIPAALVASYERVRDKRFSVEAKLESLKLAERALREKIQAKMGQHKRAGIGRTGRWLELVTVDLPRRVLQPVSYVVLKIREKVTVG